MSTSTIRICLIIGLVSAFTGAAALAEQIDNPMYGYWSHFKPGSVLKTTTDSVAAGQKSTMDTVSTLLEVTPDKLTVEMKTDVTAGDTRLKQRIRKQEVRAKIEQPVGAGAIKHSTEAITVAGRTYTCEVSEETRDTLKIKTWTNDQVPGGVVKAEMNSDGLSVTTLLVDSTVKK
jgi:hypothetical protein